MITAIKSRLPNGEVLRVGLTDSDHFEGIVVIDVQGLGGPDSISEGLGGSYLDGTTYQGRNSISERFIELQLAVTKSGRSVDPIVQKIYKFFPRRGRVTFVVDKLVHGVILSYELEAVVEKLEMSHFATVQNMTIHLKCHNPWFKHVFLRELYVSRTHDMFTFPFSNPVGQETLIFQNVFNTQHLTVVYDGDIPSGAIFEIQLGPYVFSNAPQLNRVTIHVSNNSGHRSMTIDRSKMDELTAWYNPVSSFDTVILDTRQGSKSLRVVKVSQSPGVPDRTYSAINGLEWVENEWLEFVRGVNIVTVTYDPVWTPPFPAEYGSPATVKVLLAPLHQGV